MLLHSLIITIDAVTPAGDPDAPYNPYSSIEDQEVLQREGSAESKPLWALLGRDWPGPVRSGF